MPRANRALSGYAGEHRDLSLSDALGGPLGQCRAAPRLCGNMIFANISRADSSPTDLPVPFAMNVGMTFLSPSLVKAEAFARRAIPDPWVSKDRMSGGHSQPCERPDKDVRAGIKS
jgi:hypothetical protein